MISVSPLQGERDIAQFPNKRKEGLSLLNISFGGIYLQRFQMQMKDTCSAAVQCSQQIHSLREVDPLSPYTPTLVEIRGRAAKVTHNLFCHNFGSVPGLGTSEALTYADVIATRRL